MAHRVEAYTAGGVATGILARPEPVRDVLETFPEILVEEATWLPLDGSAGRPSGTIRLAVDDVLVVVAEGLDSLPMHAQWHSIDLDAGPYRIHGEMPTLPGFDPGRALARPTGEFVLLRDVRIALVGLDDAGEAIAEHALVNRYVVDRIEADLMLGFFFPGAAMTVTGGPAAGLAPADVPGAHVAGAARVP